MAFLLVLVAPVAAREVRLTLVHTTDVHGHVLPTTDYEGRANVGGMLRVASRIESLRDTEPNVVLLDCGDLFQGAPESYRTRGLILADILNRLSYDAWVIGNHEFDWGQPALRAFLEACRVPALAANLYTLEDRGDPLPGIRPYVLLERDGVRIAVVGLTTPGIPSWSRPHLVGPALFWASTEALARVMPRVRADNPDLLVLAAHQGYRSFGDDHANQLNEVAARFPEFDVILGAHTHKPIAEEWLGRTLYSQAGYYGIWLGVVDLVYDTVERKLVAASGRLEDIGPDIPDHPGIAEAWAGELAETAAAMTQVLARAATARCPDQDGGGVASLISAAIAEAVHTDFVLHGALSDACLPGGSITEADVWAIVPYENTIGIASLLPVDIRQILDEVLAARPSIYQHQPHGFEAEILTDPDTGKQRTGRLVDAGGEPLHPRKRYRVAFNSYVLASGGTRYPVLRRIVDDPLARLTMTGIDTRAAVRAYLKRGGDENEAAGAALP